MKEKKKRNPGKINNLIEKYLTMATKRDIKKDIRYLCEQLIIDALEVYKIVKESNKPKVVSMVADIASLHNELISRTNHPDAKDNPKLVKAYFNTISNDLLIECNKFYEKLNTLISE
jgi:hypothetical protein